MAVVGEVSQGLRLREYRISFQAATWATILVLVVMAGLYAIIGLPPRLGTFYSDMYFHSIGIAALAAYLVIAAFDLRKHEPELDFPLHYRALMAVLSMMGTLADMARSGRLPEGFQLLWIRRDAGATEAFCAWQAPGKQRLESLVAGLNPPGMHVVHELHPMA